MINGRDAFVISTLHHALAFIPALFLIFSHLFLFVWIDTSMGLIILHVSLFSQIGSCDSSRWVLLCYGIITISSM